MLKHNNNEALPPSRVVILGAKGFVGKTLKRILDDEKINNLALSRQDVELLDIKAADSLIEILDEKDTLIVISAEAPVKDNTMLENNIHMMSSICQAIKNKAPAHLVYVSSDAVYADSDKLLSEESFAEPTSLHGAMHLAREVMLKNCFTGPLAIIRPTLIYGLEDPHNGYGPNRFRRLAEKGENIILFGKGEEQRDHVWVDDVAELIKKIILHKSEGILNAATGEVTSFYDIAKQVVEKSRKEIQIITTKRVGEMPHNGYRAFDPSLTIQAFPDFKYKNISQGLVLSS